jgi:c-di-GMP-binding flagellar brake protein YcgR
MFKVLRRNDLRFEIPDSFKIKVTFTDPAANSLTMTKNLIDVSRTGIGILVNTQEAGLLSKGLILENIEFSIQGYKIKCRAEVKHVSQHKVGLCFKDIDPAHSRFLGEYATKESRTLFQQMIKD